MMIKRDDRARLRVAFAFDPARLAVLDAYERAETKAGIAADAAEQFRGTTHHATTAATATMARGFANGLGAAVLKLAESLTDGPIPTLDRGTIITLPNEQPAGRYEIVEFWFRTEVFGVREFGGRLVERNDPPVPPSRNERLWPKTRADAATPVPAAYRCPVCDTVLDIMGRCPEGHQR